MENEVYRRTSTCIELFLKSTNVRFSSTYASKLADPIWSEAEIVEAKMMEGKLVTYELLKKNGHDQGYYYGVVDKKSEDILSKYKNMDTCFSYEYGYDDWWSNFLVIGNELRNILFIPECTNPSNTIVLQEYVTSTSNLGRIPEIKLELVVHGFALKQDIRYTIQVLQSTTCLTQNVNIRYMESWEEDYGFTLLLPSVIKEAIIEPSDRIMVYDDGDQKSMLRQPFSHTLSYLFKIGFPGLPEVLEQQIFSYLRIDDMLLIISMFMEGCRPLEDLFLRQCNDQQYYFKTSYRKVTLEGWDSCDFEDYYTFSESRMLKYLEIYKVTKR